MVGQNASNGGGSADGDRRGRGAGWRALSRVGIALLWIVGAVAALVLSAWLHIFTPLSRELVRDIVLAQLNAGIQGRVEVGRISEIDFGSIGLEDLVVYDPQGRRVLSVEHASAEPDLLALPTGTIHLDELHGRGGELHLIETDEGSPSIAAAFEPTEPRPDQPEGGGPSIVIDDIQLEDFSVTSTYEAARHLTATDMSLQGELSIDDGQLEASIGSAGAKVRKGGEVVASLDRLEATFTGGEGGEGGEGTIDTDLSVGDGKVSVEGSVRLPEEPGGQPYIDSEMRLDGVRAEQVQELFAQQVPQDDDEDEDVGVGKPGPPDDEPAESPPADQPADDDAPEDGAAVPNLPKGEIGGTIRFRGTPEDFEAEADLETDAGRLELRARREGERVDVEVETAELRIEELFDDLPVPIVAGNLTVEIEGFRDPSRFQATLRAQNLRIGELHFPSAVIALEKRPEEIRIQRTALPYLPGEVDVRGTVGFDGSADLHVEVHVPDLAKERNLRRIAGDTVQMAGIDASVDLRVSPTEGDAPPRIAVKGEAALHDAKVGPLRAAHLRVRGEARGRVDRPTVDLTASGEALRVADVRLRRATISVEGGPDRYDVVGRAVGPEGETFAVDADVRPTDRGGYRIGAQAAGTIAGRDLTLLAEGVHVKPAGAIEVGRAELRTGDAMVAVEGVYRPDGPSDVEARFEDVDLELIAELSGLEPLEGEVHGEIAFRGTPSHPELDAVLWWDGGVVSGVSVDDVGLVVELSSDRGILDAQVEVDLSPRGALAANVSAQFDQGRREDIADALLDAEVDALVEARDFSLAVVNDVVEDAPKVFGILDGEVRATGTIEEPVVRGVISGSDLGLHRPSELAARVQLAYADTQARVQLVAEDEHGVLGELEMAAEVDVPAVVRDPSRLPTVLDRQPWQVSMFTAARRLDALPPPLEMDVPALVAFTAHVDHRPDRPLVADADLGVTWLGDVESCVGMGRPRARARMRLNDGEARLEMIGRVGAEQVLGARVTAPFDVDRWLEEDAAPTLPPVDAEVEIAAMELSEVPWVCNYASGRLTGDVVVEDLFSDSPVILANLQGRNVRYGEAPPSMLGIQVQLDQQDLYAVVEMVDSTGGGIEAVADVPLQWRNGIPSVGDSGEFRAHLAMEGFHIEPLAVVPAVTFAEGTLNGDVDVVGTVQAPVFDGWIALDDVAFGLAQPAQRFEDGSGRIVFHRDWVEIDQLHFHDLAGTIRVSGGIGLDGLAPRRARLAVYTNDLPIRNEGMPVGELTANADVRAQIRSEEIEVWIDVEDMALEVERGIRTNIQSLEPHPDIVLVQAGVPIEEPEEEQPQLLAQDIVVHVDATDPFWVRRDDFAIQVASKLDVRLSGAQVEVGGWTQLRRGYVELLGKRFELEEGRIDFLGGTELNPRISLLLAHEPAQRLGEQVFVRVTGYLQQPELEFSSTIPGVTTAGEVIALIAGGGRGGEGGGMSETAAADQAVSFLAGVTAGILTLTARRELGDLFPDISVEATGEGARLRAGFDAEQIIPGFLEGIVRGAYVEGFVGTGGDGVEDQEGTRSEGVGGVMLELLFPRSIVFTGEVQPPAAWSAEVTWEP